MSAGLPTETSAVRAAVHLVADTEASSRRGLAEPASHGSSELDTGAPVVLIVDDVPENLALLHDALDESGYAVLVATSGQVALRRAAQALPDIILLDAVMPGLDGFEVARRLKADPATASIPIVFMTGLTDTEHVVAGFAAGGVDYVTKPIRPAEVLARMSAHLAQARVQRQARNALDAFGHATLAVHEPRGVAVWQTALARRLLETFFETPPGTDRLPAELQAWVAREALRRRAGAEPAGLSVARAARRLVCQLHAVDAAALGDDHWLVVLRMSDDSAMVDALMRSLELTAREAEVLYWVTKGKTNRDIGEILGSSPRTVHKHLEHVFQKLHVETRTAAAALALARVAALGVSPPVPAG
jgi:DNA-binding response OmpR family regulator/DNA-binding CsgD family transcriptional regulator